MKKLTAIFFALLSFTLSYAQGSKPTKEETIQYIKSELESEDMLSFERKYMDAHVTKEEEIFYNYSDVTLNTCVLSFSYTRTINRKKDGESIASSDSPSKKEIDSIDFSKIEEINGFRRDLGDNMISSKSYIILRFVSKGGKSLILRIQKRDADTDVDYESLKIYKAFQHLRKLCGAPEPISFD